MTSRHSDRFLRISRPSARFLMALVVACAPFGAQSAGAVSMTVSAQSENFRTGSMPTDGPHTATSGDVIASVPTSPGLGLGLPFSGLALAFAEEGGVYYASASSGIDPGTARADVVWTHTYTRTAGPPPDFVISGAGLDVLDFNGRQDDLYANLVLGWDVSGGYGGVIDVEISGDAGSFVTTDDGNVKGTFIPDSSFPDNALSWRLATPVRVELDVSHVPIGGTYDLTFLLTVRVRGGGGESQALAYLRDPISGGGGIQVPSAVVPEPHTGSLVLAGAGLLAAWRRRAGRGSRSTTA